MRFGSWNVIILKKIVSTLAGCGLDSSNSGQRPEDGSWQKKIEASVP
jgi:hypothetical protein